MSSAKKDFKTPDLTIEDLTLSLYNVNQKLQQTIRERDEIYANISHDLRSPVTAIHNSIEYLQSLEHVTEKDIQSVLPLLYERTLILEKMINDIFLLTKLDSADSLLHMKDIPARDFLEDFFFMCDADTKYNDRNLILDVSESLSATICIDPIYMNRALDNLFSNALKFTHSNDTIKLSATYKASYLQIVVSDTGIGIDPHELENVFRRSYMTSSARTPSVSSGAGLGLSICKSIVEKHNGTIKCKSNPAKYHGSHFIIELPASETVK